MDRKHFLRLAFSAVAAAALSLFSRRAHAASAEMRVAAPVKPWDKVEFTYPGAARSFPGVAVRLPEKSGGGLCAVCRICPHQGCVFGYETDYETVGGIIGKDLANPVFFCRCHMSTFDPAQDGSVLYGPTARRPWRFTVREEGGDMVVSDIEAGAGEIG
jgi:Rieske Fe-S protein